MLIHNMTTTKHYVLVTFYVLMELTELKYKIKYEHSALIPMGQCFLITAFVGLLS